MPDFKMLCLDIDGTLLNSNHLITDATKQAIRQTVMSNHTYVVLVSARMPKGIRLLLKELQIDMPFVCYSGGLIVKSAQDSTILFNRTMSTTLTEQVIHAAQSIDVQCSLYKDDEWLVERTDEYTRQESEITGTIPIVIDFPPLLHDWAESNNVGPNKILCIGREYEIERLETKLNHQLGHHLSIYRSKPNYLEIMDKHASKKAGISYLQEIYRIKASQVIAIGDNFNDIDMIEHAGLGVAMRNAPDEVKKYADEVTESNDEEGVARIIHKYLLK